MHEVMGGNGLHLYPQASYWDWPYSADSVRGRRLLQIERDWIWYKAWSRYAWKAKRDRQEEIAFWSRLLSGKFGCSLANGRQILAAYEESGQIAPKILRRFGITDGNRQTMTLGMLMTQLTNPNRFGLFTLLYESESPEGEMLNEYAAKEVLQQAHTGETPVAIAEQIRQHGRDAVAAIEEAASGVTKDIAEFDRLKNDMHCYQALADHYSFKTTAALNALMYKYTGDINWLDKSLPYLEQSVKSYQHLVELTKGTYLYANSMQTKQRKIPIRGVDGTFKTWAEVLVPFNNELYHFRQALDSLKHNKGSETHQQAAWKNIEVKLESDQYNKYSLSLPAIPFTDTTVAIGPVAPELKQLMGWQMSFWQQVQRGTYLSFSNTVPVKLLVGYFNSKDPHFLQPPQLETDATANDRGQAEAKIVNAMVVTGMPPVNVHSFDFAPGRNAIRLPRGACLILGFIDGSSVLRGYDAGITEKAGAKEIDWLFE
jgi:hypothetical protein